MPAKDDHNYHFEVFLNNLCERKHPTANPETCQYATALVMRPYRHPWKLVV